MDGSVIIELCAFGFEPCWTRGEWITLWSSFAGVLAAFLLGSLSQFLVKRRREKAASKFLKKTLLKSLEAISFFDNEYRKIGNDDQIGHGFGGLGHASAAVKWAVAHPEKFDPDFFLRLLKIEDRVIASGYIGPAKFAGTNFIIDASTHLSRKVPPVASDIRFLLALK